MDRCTDPTDSMACTLFGTEPRINWEGRPRAAAILGAGTGFPIDPSGSGKEGGR
jgi:hypothetical protein